MDTAVRMAIFLALMNGILFLLIAIGFIASGNAPQFEFLTIMCLMLGICQTIGGFAGLMNDS